MEKKFSFFLILTIVIGIFIKSSVLHAESKWIYDVSFQFVCSEWPPFEYTLDDGKLTGFSIEILRSILKKLKIKDAIKIYPWKRAYVMVQKNKNTLCFTMARTKKRENLFKWVGPIAPREIFLWKLKDRKIVVNNWEDVKKYRIGTVRGEAGESQLINKGFIVNKNIIVSNNAKLHLKQLYTGRVDFIYALKLTILFQAQKDGYDPDKLEKSLLLNGELEYYYAFNKETSDYIVEAFYSALLTIKENGEYNKIAKKYGLNSKGH